eukprot:c22016_g2_i5.p1 GENE.c22016_g2_i5~~c22016_g2_i5.p1  ORF type:complete len:284 (+),score=91.89 c22016_g2_i5:44-853(+)
MHKRRRDESLCFSAPTNQNNYNHINKKPNLENANSNLSFPTVSFMPSIRISSIPRSQIQQQNQQNQQNQNQLSSSPSHESALLRLTPRISCFPPMSLASQSIALCPFRRHHIFRPAEEEFIEENNVNEISFTQQQTNFFDGGDSEEDDGPLPSLAHTPLDISQLSSNRSLDVIVHQFFSHITPEELHVLTSVNWGEQQVQQQGAKEEEIRELKKYTLSADEHDCCCICLDKLCKNQEVRQLNCVHHFHLDCIDQWLKINKSCPLCKITI